jgi:hypothetical protein
VSNDYWRRGNPQEPLQHRHVVGVLTYWVL